MSGRHLAHSFVRFSVSHVFRSVPPHNARRSQKLTRRLSSAESTAGMEFPDVKTKPYGKLTYSVFTSDGIK